MTLHVGKGEVAMGLDALHHISFSLVKKRWKSLTKAYTLFYSKSVESPVY